MSVKNLHITEAVSAKLKEKHGVSRVEIEQCFANKAGRLLEDSRAHVKTVPPTLWFIACTNKGRALKVVYIQKGASVELKTAYEPNEEESRIYKRHG